MLYSGGVVHSVLRGGEICDGKDASVTEEIFWDEMVLQLKGRNVREMRYSVIDEVIL